MIEITDRDIFGEVIAEALVKVELNASLTSGLRVRWINAIAKAAARLDDTQFIMDWDAEAKRLLIWTVGTTNQIYEVNGRPHGCDAEANGQPCWHLAAKRLVENYVAKMDALEAVPEPKRDLQEFNSAPYLAPKSEAKTEKVGNIRI